MLIGQRYQVMSLLGAGGMGGVYRALDRLTGQEVALKQVQLGPDGKARSRGGRPDAQPNSNTALRTFRLALAHEFRTLATLRHPNIVGVLDYGFDAAREPFFTMQLLEQPSDLISAARGAELPAKLSIMAQLLRALVYLHRHNIIHRDLKPRKVAVDGDRTPIDPQRCEVLANVGFASGPICGSRPQGPAKHARAPSGREWRDRRQFGVNTAVVPLTIPDIVQLICAAAVVLGAYDR